MSTLAIDIETFSDVDIRKSGMYKYAESPFFEIILFAYSYDGAPVQVIDLLGGEVVPDHILLALTNPNVLKTAHNAPFEMACISTQFGVQLDPAQWECTMARVAQLGLPLSLDAAAKALGLSAEKDKTGKALIKYFCEPCKPTKTNGHRTRNYPHHDPEKWAAFIEYNRQDVVVEQAIRKATDFFEFPASEKQVWQLDYKINTTGILLDPVFIEKAIQIDQVNASKLFAEAIALTGLDNPNSVAQLKDWLEAETGETVEKLNKESVSAMLEDVVTESAGRVLDIRQQMSKTSVKKYAAMVNTICADNRVRGIHQYYGANRTGRWAGRLIQPQNLRKNDLKDLDLARRVVREQSADDLEFLFGDVPDVLSQLIRTAFVAPAGSRFIVSDFSAIEARVIAWLAGERWRLDVFNTHGKIYEASAAQMFKVPLESINKDGENYHLRAKGKIAELALGYQGGPGALAKMGALKMGLVEEELKPLVDMWRRANTKIVQLWYKMGDAAVNAVDTLERVNVDKGISFQVRSGVLWMQLPSGRRLAYQSPRIDDGQYGPIVSYMGMDQTTKQWKRVESYGGKFVENCLAGDTPVITNNGIKSLSSVTLLDLVWDGVEWVNHEGLSYKGDRYTFNLNGIYLTYEHKIFTTEDWKTTSQIQGHYGAAVALPDGYELRRVRRGQINLGHKLRMWKNSANARNGISKRENKVLRLQKQRNDIRKEENARPVQTPSLLGMAQHEITVQQSRRAGVPQLRRAGNIGVRKMARIIRELLRGCFTGLRAGAEHRTYRREWQLYPGERTLDTTPVASEEQKGFAPDFHSVGDNDRGGSSGQSGHKTFDNVLPNKQRLSAGALIRRRGFYQPVYDLINCGPRQRFTVLTETGPIIVHNCVQAISRDILAHALVKIDAAGYKTVMHVHDEIVSEMPYGTGSADEVKQIMSEPIPWAAGLPLGAEAYETEYYKKD